MRVEWRRLAGFADAASFTLVAPLFGLGTGLVVTYWQGAAVWGQIVGLQLLVVLGANLAGWGLLENALPDMAMAPHRAVALWRSHFKTRLVLLAPPYAVAAGGIGLLSDPERLGSIAMLVGIWVPLTLAIRAYDTLANHKGLLGKVAQINVTWSFVRLLAIAVLASHSQFTLPGLVALLVLADLGRLLNRITALRVDPLHRDADARGEVRPDLIVAGTPLAISSFIPSLAGRLDSLLVALFLNDHLLGLHSLISAIFGFLRMSGGIASIALAPKIVRLPMRSVWKISRLNFLFGFVASPIAGVGAFWLLTLALELPVSVTLITSAAVASLPVFASSPLIFRAQAQRLAGQVLWIGAAGLAMQIVASSALLPWYGLIGAQLALLMAGCYRFAAAVWLLQRGEREGRFGG